MKLAKISVAAMIALGTSAIAADSLEGAFKNGSFKGEARAYYFNRHTAPLDADMTTFALKLHYETDAYKGFKIGTTFQASSSPFASEEGKILFSPPHRGGLYGPGAVLSEAYLDYKLNNTDIKVGRQFINLPLLAGSGSRAILEAFEGITVINKDIPKTTLALAYVQKEQLKSDTDGSIPEFENITNDGDYAYSLSIVNKSIPGLTLTGAYGERDKNYALTHAQAIYKNKTNTFRYNLGFQYGDTAYKTAAEDSTYYGVKLGAGMGGFNAYTAFVKIEDGESQYNVSGTGKKINLFTTTRVGAGQHFASNQYAVDTNYFFKPYGLLVGARYVNIDYTDEATMANGLDFMAGTKEEWKAVYAMYKFPGALKGLTSILHFGDKSSTKASNEGKFFRLRNIYKF